MGRPYPDGERKLAEVALSANPIWRDRRGQRVELEKGGVEDGEVPFGTYIYIYIWNDIIYVILCFYYTMLYLIMFYYIILEY